ncbi:MAG: hypothetical protein EOO42_08900 [Flavobacteriales bacterium]|nr:MAG: hypothetical protein EOO42_08900 [Flavobacteriales bacterium]
MADFNDKISKKTPKAIPYLNLKYLLTLCFIFCLFNGFGQSIHRQEKNVKAFAELFGHVRFFHPSDEAQKVYWNIFALYGANRVLNLKDDTALITELESLFAPIAPTVVISKKKPNKDEILRDLTPKDRSNYRKITLVNNGIELPYGNSMYKSKRINRDSIDNNHFEFLVDTKNAKFKKGQNFIFSVDLRADTASCIDTGLFVGFSTSSKGNFATYGRSLLSDGDAKKYNFSGEFSNDADTIGFLIRIAKTRVVKSFANPSLVVFGDNSIADTVRFVRQADFGNVNQNHYNLILEIGEVEYLPEVKLDSSNLVTKEISKGIFATVPETLFGNVNGTFPQVDSTKFNDFLNQLRKFNTEQSEGYRRNARLSNSIVIWTAFKYGFPYWDDADMSIEAAFKHLFFGAMEASSDMDYLKTLRLLSAKMNDGHMFVSYSGSEGEKKKAIPVVVEKIGEEIVVRHVLDTGYQHLKAGNVVRSIDGQVAMKKYNSIYELTSGSPQWRNYKSLLGIFDGKEDSVDLVISTDENRLKMRLSRSLEQQEHRSGALLGLVPKNGRFKGDIFYYNLTGDSIMKELTASMETLKTAKSIIFDLRGYPKENINNLVRHFIKCTEHTRWLHIPIVSSVDKKPKFQSSGWNLSPQLPYLNAKIIFLTDESAQSYPESILGYVKGLKLGTIIGRPTSGANGDIQTVHLYNDFRIFYSGLKVTNLDGTKNHVVGIIPDIIVNPTKESLLKGKDEILEKALEIARTYSQ